MERKIKEAKKEVAQSPTSANQEVVTLLSEMNGLLRSMNGHLKSLVYYQEPSRGFSAGIDAAIAQPFVTESADIKRMVREELRNMGDK